MEAHNPDVTVVIASWNTADLLSACLRSLKQNIQSVRAEVIVVDNASHDGSAQMVARDFPEVQLCVNARNRGFAAASNQGIRQAHGRYVLLLNSDTVVLPGAVEHMVRYMDEHPRSGAVGPRLLNQDYSLQVSARDFPRLGRDTLAILKVARWPLVGHLAHRRTRRYWSDHRQTRPVDWVMGACMMLRREAIEQVGPLDEGYFFFAEELDLCYRLRQRGWTTVFLANAEIIHLGGQSAAQVPAARLVWHYTALLRYYRLHQPRRHYLALRAVIAVTAAAHIPWLLVRHRHTAGSRLLLTAYAAVVARAAW